jgi:hypothetical protein
MDVCAGIPGCDMELFDEYEDAAPIDAYEEAFFACYDSKYSALLEEQPESTVELDDTADAVIVKECTLLAVKKIALAGGDAKEATIVADAANRKKCADKVFNCKKADMAKCAKEAKDLNNKLFKATGVTDEEADLNMKRGQAAVGAKIVTACKKKGTSPGKCVNAAIAKIEKFTDGDVTLSKEEMEPWLNNHALETAAQAKKKCAKRNKEKKTTVACDKVAQNKYMKNGGDPYKFNKAKVEALAGEVATKYVNTNDVTISATYDTSIKDAVDAITQDIETKLWNMVPDPDTFPDSKCGEAWSKAQFNEKPQTYDYGGDKQSGLTKMSIKVQDVQGDVEGEDCVDMFLQTFNAVLLPEMKKLLDAKLKEESGGKRRLTDGDVSSSISRETAVVPKSQTYTYTAPEKADGEVDRKTQAEKDKKAEFSGAASNTPMWTMFVAVLAYVSMC